MSGKDQPRFCAVCAWRENCAKKFGVPDGGARCPEFSRDVSLRPDSAAAEEPGGEEQ